MEPKLALSFLGKMSVVLSGQDITERFSVKHQALLAYLVMTGQTHSRAALARMFWGDDIGEGDELARNSLRVALSGLRKSLADYLVLTRTDVAFDRQAGCAVDVAEFERLSHELDLATTADLQQAAALYRGDFLADLMIEDVAAIDEWLLFQREYWRRRAMSVLERLADNLLGTREFGEAALVLTRALAIEPWDEETHRKLMVAYGRMGNFNAALMQYERLRQLLLDELGVEPDDETTALYNRIQTARQTRPRTLPLPGTEFIGRYNALAEIAGHLADPDCRVLTITGLGGVGKTRLALAAAGEANRLGQLQFLHGVAFVSLVGVGQVDLVVTAVADELGLSLVGLGGGKRQLLDYLREREMLLVLDNFEDVVEGWTLVQEMAASCPGVKLLITSREPLLLAGERRLHLDGLAYPQAWDKMMTVGEALAYEAVRLFVQSAQQVRPSYSLETADIGPVVRLCRLVSGLPLALQLAAAWLRVMGVREITAEVERNLDLLATRLRDMPPRQRSIRAVFEQTWSLLSAAEQTVFQSLAVFRGGFSPEAARTVLAGGLKWLNGLAARGLLQEKVIEGQKRYELHELARLFAAEKLAESDVEEAAVSERHSQFYLGLVAGNESKLYGERPQLALSTLLPDMQNIRLAWRWAVSRADFEQLDRAVEGLTILFDLPGLYGEVLPLLDEAVKRLTGLDQERENGRLPDVICHLTLKVGFFHLRQGSPQTAYTIAIRGLAVAAERGLERYTAEANAILGDISKRLPLEEKTEVYYRRAADIYQALAVERPLASLNNALGWQLLYDSPEEALACFQEALEIHRRLGNTLGMATSAGSIAIVQFDKGETEGAVERLMESLRLYEAGGYLAGAGATTHNLGKFHYTLGAYDKSLSFYRRSIEIKKRLGRLDQEFLTVGAMGAVYIETGQYHQAQQALAGALDYFEENGPESEMLAVLWELAYLLIRLGQFETAEANLERVRAAARQEGKGNVRALAIATGLLGILYQFRHEADRALAFFEEAAELFQTYKQPIDAARYALLPMAMILVSQGRLAEAEALAEQVRPLTTRVGWNPIVLDQAVLAARIEQAGGRKKDALTILDSVTANEERPIAAAVLAYERWRLTGNQADGQSALSLHEPLAAQIPDIHLRQQTEKLKAALAAWPLEHTNQ